jgi:hypothetical protein
MPGGCFARPAPAKAAKQGLLFVQKTVFSIPAFLWGRTGFDGDVEAGIAGRGAAGLVKSGKQVIGNDYEYAYAA